MTVTLCYFVEHLILGLSGVFSRLDGGYALLGRTPQRSCALLRASCQGVHYVCVSYHYMNLGHLVKVLSAGFLHCQVAVFPFVIDILGEVL